MKHLDPNGNETCDRVYLLHNFINSMERNQIVQNKHCAITVLGKTLRSNYVELAKLLLHSIIVQLHQLNCKSFTTYALIIFSSWNMKGMTNKRLRLQKKNRINCSQRIHFQNFYCNQLPVIRETGYNESKMGAPWHSYYQIRTVSD